MYIVQEVIDAKNRLEKINKEQRVTIYPELYKDIELILSFTDDMLSYLRNGKSSMDFSEVICHW